MESAWCPDLRHLGLDIDYDCRVVSDYRGGQPSIDEVPLANPVVFLWNQSRSNDHVTWASACSLCVSVLISGLMYWDQYS